MKRFLIAGNWKMNKTAKETDLFFATLPPLLSPEIQSELLICPPFTSLPAAAKANEKMNLSLGAQDVYPKSSGAFTGEIAPAMLREWVSYVLVGHSERRTLFHETNAFVNEKIHALLKEKLKPILCVGETLEERKQHRADLVIREELEQGLKGVTKEQLSQLTIAYEPIWAIGTGETATPETAETMHALIHDWLVQQFDASSAEVVRLLYGGSLKSSNAKPLLQQPHIDGGLIGGASLEPRSFIEIARIADQIRK